MALVATSVGTETDEDGNEMFVIRLWAQTEADIPALTAADVWDEVPLVLSRAVDPNDYEVNRINAELAGEA